MASYTAWGQRKALGKRYAIDPAQLYESQRLAEEYSMAVPREERAFRQKQFDTELAFREKQMESQEKSGMASTAGNLATTAITLNALKAITPAQALTPAQTDIAATYGLSPAETSAIGTTFYGVEQEGFNLAQQKALEAGATYEEIGALGSSGVDVAGGGAALGYGSAAGWGAAGGYVGGQFGQVGGKALGIGGRKERGAVGGAIGGAGAAAAAGAMYGTPAGPVGMAVGAVVGGIVGFATSGETWICTEISNRFGLDEATVDILSKLKRYSIKNHREESEYYYKNGKILTTAINKLPNRDIVYKQLKEELVDRCKELVDDKKMEEAYHHYKKITEALCAIYDVDLMVKEAA